MTTAPNSGGSGSCHCCADENDGQNQARITELLKQVEQLKLNGGQPVLEAKFLDLKQAAKKAVDDLAQEMDEVSAAIHANPELNYKEHFAHKVLTDFLEKQGFEVERGYLGLATGFRATVKGAKPGPTVSVCLEYDALPGIGHACGHNLIALSGLAAGVGAKAALEAHSDKLAGTLVLLGTPAEEGGGGKVIYIEKGVFKDFDFSMMAHPAPMTLAYVNALAIDALRIRFYGKNAHAAAFPYDGVNALDAVVAAFHNIGAMRQQFKSTWRVHGIIAKGGDKPNIIPDYTEAHFYIRAPTDAELEDLRVKVMGCFNGAGIATGCRVEVDQLVECDDTELGKLFRTKYKNIISNGPMCDSYKSNMSANALDLDTTFLSKEEELSVMIGSTDMGNVTHELPAMHPAFAIPTNPGEGNHHPGFTAMAGTPAAMKIAREVGLGMACTCIDLFADPEMAKAAKEDFAKARAT